MLNHSCTRCRSKKLRCDGSSPCSNCRAKGISHVCQRAQRKERPRKSAVTAAAATVTTKRFSPPSSSLIDEVTAGSALARLHVRTDTDRSTSTSTSSTSAATNTTAIRPESEPARSPLSSASSSSSSKAAPPPPPPPPAVHFSPAPPHFRGCLVTPKIIADAREYIGALHPALRLINYVFQWRCQSMAHSCVHLPTIKHTLRQLFSDEWAPEIAQDQLALALMAVAMSIQFSPRRGPYAHVFQVVQALGPALDPVERQQRIHQLARSIVQSRMLDTNTSLEGVQTIVLLLIYDLDDESFKERLWLSAVRGAQSLRLNHIQHDYYSGAAPSLESELGVRVWWFLVCRDWLYALARGTYKLHPNHFTTRLPMIITDEDLAEGRTPNRQAGEVSPVSVSIPFIGLASLIRQLVDIRAERTPDEFSQDVADAFDTFVETLPHIFSLSTTHIASLDDNVFTQQRLESERWLLHQQIFHAYMHFDDLRLDRPICPQMVALASHTLQLQDRVRARCHIIDSMRINVTGVLRAITVLTIDLLQKHRDSKVSLARQVTLGKIKEAIYKCEASPNLAEGDLDNVYKLIEMEESAWVAKSRSMVPRRSVFTLTPLQSVATANGTASLLTAPALASAPVPMPTPTPHSLGTTSSQTSLNEGGGGGGGDSTGPGSYSGTASEGSVGTTSPVVDMPVVPMDLPGSSANHHHHHHQAKTQQRDSIPSVLLSSAEHSSRAHQQQADGMAGGIMGGMAGGMYSHQPQSSQQSQMSYHQTPQQASASFPSGMPAGVNGHAHNMSGINGGGGFAQGQGPAYTHSSGAPFSGMLGGYSSFQQQAQQPQQPPQQQQQQQQQHLDVAQWAALVPSDQALSPIFAPDLLAAHTPSWAELYATFGA